MEAIQNILKILTTKIIEKFKINKLLYTTKQTNKHAKIKTNWIFDFFKQKNTLQMSIYFYLFFYKGNLFVIKKFNCFFKKGLPE